MSYRVSFWVFFSFLLLTSIRFKSPIPPLTLICSGSSRLHFYFPFPSRVWSYSLLLL
jgi:hypothetical protein